MRSSEVVCLPNKENVNNMISIIEGQISDLRDDLKTAKHWVTRSVIRKSIDEYLKLLDTAKSKLN